MLRAGPDRHRLGTLADHDNQFGLVVRFMIRVGDSDLVAVADQRGGRLHEEDGFRRHLAIRIALGNMGFVVETDADDLARVDRRQELELIDLAGNFAVVAEPEGRFRHVLDIAFACDAPVNRRAIPKPDDPHSTPPGNCSRKLVGTCL